MTTTGVDDAYEFFRARYGDDSPGYLAICTLEKPDNMQARRFYPLRDLRKAAEDAVRWGQSLDTYYGVCLQRDRLCRGRGGTDTVQTFPGPFMDIDFGTDGHAIGNRPPDYKAARSLLDALPFPPSYVVDSGHGIHVYYSLHEPYVIETAEERQYVADIEQRFQQRIKAEAAKRHWSLDTTKDLARLLRVPGTTNFKNDLLPVRVVECDLEARYSLEDFERYLPSDAGVEQPLRSDGSNRSNDNDFDTASFEMIASECAFLAHCQNDATTLSEPDWYKMITVSARCDDGEQLTHDLSKPYPGYSPSETSKKITQALSKTRPYTCEKIREDGGEQYCSKCQHWGKVKSPIVLGHAAVGATFQLSRTFSKNDFRAYMPEHKYIFIPSRELWPSSSVNAKLGHIVTGSKSETASAWLDRNQSVEQMTWAPGEKTLIKGRLISNGDWIHHPGTTCFNLYRRPTIKREDAGGAGRWVGHIHHVYPNDADHIINWLAHRVQHPGVKINRALVLGGQQGIGKDTLLEPVKHAIGPWNFQEVSPVQLLGRFNGFVKSVILRVSEARDLGDVDRYGFYEHLKVYTAAPPDVLRCDEKNVREYSVLNVCGVVITSNHKTDGIYLPADDRRHYVAWSELTMDDFGREYWPGLWRWFEADGYKNVAAYLAELDISGFDPKAPPPKTQAFWDIVDSNRAPEDAELADALDGLQMPDATTIEQIANKATVDFAGWMQDRKNRRQIPYRLEAAGYVAVRNDAAADGLWKIGGKRQMIYARRKLPIRDRISAAQQLTGR